MFKFRVATGKHRQDGKKYVPGDTFHHARRLDQEFVNKFEFLGESSPQAEKQKDDVKRDLTSRFPVARRLGFQIWGQARNRYFIVNPDTGEAVNDIPWKKAQVDQWLEGREREDSAPSQAEETEVDSTPTKKKKPGRPPKKKQKEEPEEDPSDEEEDFEDMGLE